MILFVLSLIVFFMSVVIHEYSHGWVAYKLGDATAKYSGRLTLNPLAHIDLIGTILLPLFLIMTGAHFIFGWAKPVPINYWNLHHPKRDMMWVGLSGPAANLILAITMSLILRTKIPLSIAIYLLIKTIAEINLILAVFNLIPIPPLDGSRIMMGLLPEQIALRYAALERFGFIIVILLIWPIFNLLVWPTVEFLSKILGL